MGGQGKEGGGLFSILFLHFPSPLSFMLKARSFNPALIGGGTEEIETCGGGGGG